MKRIWLKIEGIQLCDFYHDKDKNSAWANIKMGHEGFVVRGYFFQLEKDGYITQNPAMARMRFLDVPLLHRDKKKPEMILEYALVKVIHDTYLIGEKSEEFKSFLEGKTGLTEFPFIKPAEWEGKSLRIPVDFIALRSLSASLLSNGSVYANINVGEHLIFWEQLVFDRKDFHYGGSGSRDSRDAICDKRVIAVINYLLSRKDLQNHIRYLSETRGHDLSNVAFFEKTADCDEKRVTEIISPRPIRFY